MCSWNNVRVLNYLSASGTGAKRKCRFPHIQYCNVAVSKGAGVAGGYAIQYNLFPSTAAIVTLTICQKRLITGYKPDLDVKINMRLFKGPTISRVSICQRCQTVNVSPVSEKSLCAYLLLLFANCVCQTTVFMQASLMWCHKGPLFCLLTSPFFIFPTSNMLKVTEK